MLHNEGHYAFLNQIKVWIRKNLFENFCGILKNTGEIWALILKTNGTVFANPLS